MEEKHDECGVAAVRAPSGNAAGDLMAALVALQHRGQESAGIATHDGKKMFSHRGMGLANEVFASAEGLEKLEGSVGIAHVRYSTTGSSVLANAQPMVVEAKGLKLAVALNGNIINYAGMRKSLEGKGYPFSSTTDTECLGLMLLDRLVSGKDAFAAGAEMMDLLDGAYCIVALTGDGQVIAMRDPKGFRPLVLGERGGAGGATVIASESCALDAVGAEFKRSVEPGEVVVLNGGVESRVVSRSARKAHCMFEYVYIARPDSVIEGRTVIEVRERLGAKLHELYPGLKNKVDVVVPIPDSGRSAAHGYHRATGLKLAEALQKNRYIHRTFIMPGSSTRERALKLKLNVIKSIVEGKSVALVDDSIVRGTTMRKLIGAVRAAGAREVHLLISCPPIISPCFMGIDFATYDELLAPGKSLEEIRGLLGVDSLNYMTVDGLVEAIGIPAKDLCTACITGDYPTKGKPDVLRGKGCSC